MSPLKQFPRISPLPHGHLLSPKLHAGYVGGGLIPGVPGSHGGRPPGGSMVVRAPTPPLVLQASLGQAEYGGEGNPRPPLGLGQRQPLVHQLQGEGGVRLRVLLILPVLQPALPAPEGRCNNDSCVELTVALPAYDEDEDLIQSVSAVRQVRGELMENEVRVGVRN